ncbi:MAG: SRPBCC family protein [Bacteroidota bacterium]
MKKLIRVSMLAYLMLTLSFSLVAQKKTKKVQKFSISKVIDLPAEKVWEIVAEDYGRVAHSHPKIMASDYTSNSLKGEKGARRYCTFNAKGTKKLVEEIESIDHENMTFVNVVNDAQRFPVVPDLTRATYKVEAIDAYTSKISFDMQYRTKPAFMGAMAKGSFKKLIKDYFIAIEHHGKTGESVTKENFRKIKKKYT